MPKRVTVCMGDNFFLRDKGNKTDSTPAINARYEIVFHRPISNQDTFGLGLYDKRALSAGSGVKVWEEV